MLFRSETSASYEARSAPSPYPTFVRSGGIFAILFHYAMLRSCWRSAVSTSTTQRSGAGCNITAPELEQRLRRHLKPTNKSWRVEETYWFR